jgi:PTH2 family peptidyl-tRNA hydrolase
MNGAFNKTICEAKNRNHLMKAVKYAEELGLEEGKDFFLIKDNCYTELEPEDEDGRTLTAIGFRPMATETAHKISKKFQLFNAEMER